MGPLLNAEKLFKQMEINLFPLNISASSILPISDCVLIDTVQENFPLIIVRKNKIF